MLQVRGGWRWEKHGSKTRGKPWSNGCIMVYLADSGSDLRKHLAEKLMESNCW